MIKRMIGYAGAFLLTLYCFFLYEERIVGTMLIVEIVYFLIAASMLIWSKRRIQVKMEPLIPVAEKGQKITIRVRIQNAWRLWPVQVRIRLMLENSFTGETCRYQTEGIIRNGSGSLSADLQAESCGNIQIHLERCWIYDGMGILRIGRKVKETQKVGILPECHLIPVEVTRRTREFIADAEEYSDRESGDDPAEIYQVREYRERDSVHDIHWKLSAKADDLLVKEHGRPLGSVVLIWLNLERKKETERKKKRMVPDSMLEAAASLSFSLLEEKCVHMAAWYEPENHQIVKRRISREEHIYELLNRLLFVVPYQESEEVNVQFEETFRGESFSSVAEFRTDGCVRIVSWENFRKEEFADGVEVQLPDRAEEVKWDELYFTV